MALLRAKQALSKRQDENPGIQAGINIVLRAPETPARQIAGNAGGESSIVLAKITANKSGSFGFDAQTEDYVDIARRRHRRSG